MELFLIESDPVRGWKDERTTYNPGSSVRTSSQDLYRDFRVWCGNQGIQTQHIPSQKSFGRRLSTMLPGLPPDNKRKSHGTIYYPGLGFKDAPQDVNDGEGTLFD